MVFNLRSLSFSSADEDDPTPPKSFSLKELRDATNQFGHRNIVGGGDFGLVYRGRLADGSLVAVKRAVTIDQEKEEIFEREMQVASSVSIHPNVLSQRGFCRAKRELLLSTGPLDWITRKRIALGAARGLAHLHNRGFSTAVIMQERNVQEGIMKSRVEDSVASDSGSQTYHGYDDVYADNVIHGVLGFVAPEYRYTVKCTLKNDVFAYGRTLLQLVSGQATWNFFPLAFDKHIILEELMDGGIIMNELKMLIDPELQGNYPEEEAEGLVRLALLCTHDNPSVRPEMSQVIRMLESQLLRQDPSSRSSQSLSEHDSTPYYSFPPSPSSEVAP
ncbi:hypothetical protein BT93_E0259 [Corymbia citriodora subsp. variegata]|nr:hypothetical protein BT93_E0259 [Corymbia citriodora subsp. variegata]